MKARPSEAQRAFTVLAERRPKPHLATSFLPTGRVWRHRLCPLWLGENVSNGIREKLAKQMKKDKTKAPVLQLDVSSRLSG